MSNNNSWELINEEPFLKFILVRTPHCPKGMVKNCNKTKFPILKIKKITSESEYRALKRTGSIYGELLGNDNDIRQYENQFNRNIFLKEIKYIHFKDASDAARTLRDRHSFKQLLFYMPNEANALPEPVVSDRNSSSIPPPPPPMPQGTGIPPPPMPQSTGKQSLKPTPGGPQAEFLKAIQAGVKLRKTDGPQTREDGNLLLAELQGALGKKKTSNGPAMSINWSGFPDQLKAQRAAREAKKQPTQFGQLRKTQTNRVATNNPRNNKNTKKTNPFGVTLRRTGRRTKLNATAASPNATAASPRRRTPSSSKGNTTSSKRNNKSSKRPLTLVTNEKKIVSQQNSPQESFASPENENSWFNKNNTNFTTNWSNDENNQNENNPLETGPYNNQPETKPYNNQLANKLSKLAPTLRKKYGNFISKKQKKTLGTNNNSSNNNNGPNTKKSSQSNATNMSHPPRNSLLANIRAEKQLKPTKRQNIQSTIKQGLSSKFSKAVPNSSTNNNSNNSE